MIARILRCLIDDLAVSAILLFGDASLAIEARELHRQRVQDPNSSLLTK